MSGMPPQERNQRPQGDDKMPQIPARIRGLYSSQLILKWSNAACA